MEYSHIPVMWEQLRHFLKPVALEGSVFVDCTLGEGGHSNLMLDEFTGIAIIAFERDPEILQVARKRLSVYENRIVFVNANFTEIERYLANEKRAIRAFVYDFGISGYHFEKSKRGFSFRDDEPLDMRLDERCTRSAKDIVNTDSEMALAEIFAKYGQERWSKRIARAICDIRQKKAIETSRELAEIVLRAIPARYRSKRIHPATRVFQALRIAVNEELSAISTSIPAAIRLLASGGRLCAISFHSLEDRIVKNAFRRAERGCLCNDEPCRCYDRVRINVLTKKPVVPTIHEIARNKRSRSAKMRVAEKL
ncbi:MAG: 16S rRNA (cytosine(1402)-N(4))-methyltransferase RsmH [Spirochaetes bacterium]|nr:16S rRNA (cytosine(1402)-N(4))-methyltransferase RsmH [Spirochaetota bacterium]